MREIKFRAWFEMTKYKLKKYYAVSNTDYYKVQKRFLFFFGFDSFYIGHKHYNNHHILDTLEKAEARLKSINIADKLNGDRKSNYIIKYSNNIFSNSYNVKKLYMFFFFFGKL
jgi:hypothetical protein